MAKPTISSPRCLWILRHAKAASDPPWGGGDRERPLTARGRRDASALGARLAVDGPILGLEEFPRPELAICSAAVRTRQTTDRIVEAMGGQLPVDAYRSLYEADTDLVLQYLREVDEGVRSVLLVGHNPAMYRLAWELTGADLVGDGVEQDGDPTTAHAVLEAHGFPTCALAALSLQGEAWEDVAHGCGRLAGVFKPPY
jgi:phosphohistidine phosphatase